MASPCKATRFVAPTGSDLYDGSTLVTAFHSFERAQEAVLTLDGCNVVVKVAPGFYSLHQTLDLEPPVNGNLTWIAMEPGTAVLSGGVHVDGWKQQVESTNLSGQGMWCAPMPARATGRQLWLGETRATRARHPNRGYLRWQSALPAPFAAWGLVYEVGALEEWGQSLVGVDVVVFHSWSTSRHVVRRHDVRKRTIIFDRPALQALGVHLRQSGRRFFVEGWMGALDAPGTCQVVTVSSTAGAASILPVSPACLPTTPLHHRRCHRQLIK